jgi:hypothetical protein
LVLLAREPLGVVEDFVGGEELGGGLSDDEEERVGSVMGGFADPARGGRTVALP